ncbi:MAG: hypothetical protein DRQ89_15320, partial [Epsilonproteobacteria bacterium]
SDVSDLDKYTKAEVDASFSDHVNAANPHGTMIWKGVWVDGTTYNPFEVVREGNYLSIANKLTTDHVAPQENGGPELGIIAGTALTTASNQSIITVAHTYTFIKTGYIQEVYVHVPLWNTDTVVKLTGINPKTNTLTVIDNPILTTNAWTLIRANSVGMGIGDTFKLELDYFNSAKVDEVRGGWTSKLGTGTAAAQEILLDSGSAPVNIEISHTDLDSDSRANELNSVSINDLIYIHETGDASRSLELKVTAVNTIPDNSTGYTVTVIDVSKEIRDNKTCTININKALTVAQDYNKINDYFAANQPSFATVTTELYYDGVLQADTNNAFGLDIKFQPADISPDWDPLSFP